MSRNWLNWANTPGVFTKFYMNVALLMHWVTISPRHNSYWWTSLIVEYPHALSSIQLTELGPFNRIGWLIDQATWLGIWVMSQCIWCSIYYYVFYVVDRCRWIFRVVIQTFSSLVDDGCVGCWVHLLGKRELGVIIGNQQIIVSLHLEQIAGHFGPHCRWHIVRE